MRSPAWPEVMSENETIDYALRGHSIIRFGDGEILLMNGISIPYNVHSDALANELKSIAASHADAAICIPNIYVSHRKAWVEQYERFGHFFPKRRYGSQFINRPDSAPWTDTDWFRWKVRSLWLHKHVTLVRGSSTSLTPEMLATEVLSLRVVNGPAVNAYADIDSIEAEIGCPDASRGHVVVLCLGPTATCLAARLDAKGVRAYDLGMIGKFINRTKDSEPLPR